MKKPNFKSLKRFTIIDILIILCIIGAVVFAFNHTGGDEEKTEAISFDSSTMTKFGEKYLSFYREGKIVKTHVGGYNASTGKYQELSGTILWVDDKKGYDVKVLMEVDGDSNKTPILAALYKDNNNADIYIEHITLEASGEKYKNVTEIEINPRNIKRLSKLTSKMGNNTNYTISTSIAIDVKSSKVFKELSNELFLNGRKQSITPAVDSSNNQITLIMAGKDELDIASKILRRINGKTGLITIRIYNSSPEDIKSIEETFDVINIKKVT